MKNYPYCSKTIGIWGLDDNNVFTAIKLYSSSNLNCPSAITYWDGNEYTVLHLSTTSEESYSSVWGDDEIVYFGTQSGLLVRTISTGDEIILDEDDGFPVELTSDKHFIAGNHSEDFLIMGNHGEYVYFDDNGFQIYYEILNQYYDFNIYDIHFKDDLIVMVGKRINPSSGIHTDIVMYGYKR
jgi:hypothetical protein